MWSRILFGSVLTAQLVAYLASDRAIFADQPAVESSQPLFVREKTIRLEVIQGRLRILGVRGPQSRNFQHGDPDSDVRESLTIHTGAEDLVVRYESITPARKLLLSQDMRKRFVIEREVTSGATTLRTSFKQGADGHCELILPGDAQKLVCRGGIWHFSVLYPEAFRNDLAPILDELRPQWDLLTTAAKVRENLVRLEVGEYHKKIVAWATWTTDLSSEDFAVRQAADRGLRNSGPEVLGFLEQQLGQDLEKEQRARLQRIAKQLIPPTADTPELISSWLEQDPQIWVSLLTQGNIEEQRVAKQRLESMLGEQVRYDASASAAERQAMLRRLEGRIRSH